VHVVYIVHVFEALGLRHPELAAFAANCHPRRLLAWRGSEGREFGENK
jgi:hypothetical protein